MIEFDDIRFDCSLYTGYKPCRYGNECRHCPHYEPREPYASQPHVPVRQLAQGRKPASQVESILIIKTAAMGDVLRTTTLLPALKRAYPNTRITWVTDASALPLLQHNPSIHRLLPLTAEIAEALRHETFDLLLNFEKDPVPLALAGQVPARCHRGFAPTLWNTPTVFNEASQYALILGICDELKFRQNAKTYPQIIAEMAELPYERDGYELFLSESALQRREELLGTFVSAPRPWIGLNTGCGSVFRTKLWPTEHWIGLISELRSLVPGASLLLLGGPAEKDMNAQILAAHPDVIDTGCDNTLEEFLGVVDACDLVISSDSLAMHVAIALKKLVVALFGSTSATEVDLYERGEKIVTDFDCSPCYLKTCDKAPTCMQAMLPRTVAEAVVRVLKRYEQPRQPTE